MPTDAPDATVILVNYEGRGVLGACLDALEAQRGRASFEAVVVDNASQDGSWDEAEGRAGVRLVRNDRNLGFGVACNQGAAHAGGRHLAFLNFDSTPEAGWVDALVDLLDGDPAIGAAQGVVLMADGEHVNSAGNRLHYLGFGWSPLGGAPPARDAAPIDVLSASGAALAVRREAWDEVGGFWEAFFLYHEDADLSWRLWLAGWRVVVCPGARSRHAYAADRNPGKLAHLERNRLMMLAANYEGRTLLKLLPALVATEVALAAVAARAGWGRAKLDADLSALRAWREVGRQRRRVSALRTASDRTLAPRFETRLGPEFGDAIAALSAPLLAAYARLARLPAGGRTMGR